MISDDIKALREKDWQHVGWEDMDVLKRVLDALEKRTAALKEIAECADTEETMEMGEEGPLFPAAEDINDAYDCVIAKARAALEEK